MKGLIHNSSHPMDLMDMMVSLMYISILSTNLYMAASKDVIEHPPKSCPLADNLINPLNWQVRSRLDGPLSNWQDGHLIIGGGGKDVLHGFLLGVFAS